MVADRLNSIYTNIRMLLTTYRTPHQNKMTLRVCMYQLIRGGYD